MNETETVEVPVEREEVRVVREPITDADRANYDNNTARLRLPSPSTRTA